MTLTPANVFDFASLKRICEMKERKFAAAFDLTAYDIPSARPGDFFAYANRGSSVLAVAHLDTVSDRRQRTASLANTAAGPVVHSRALDDRLGAYVILDMLPALGITTDVLLTVGEETGNSTAQFFDIPDHTYDWIIEFDRGGTDVVMYQYEDAHTRDLVKNCGASVGLGSYSDIAYLDHLGIKAFNWGVGYRDYHGPRAHVYLHDTFDMVEHFQEFYAQNEGTRLVHTDEYDIPAVLAEDTRYPRARYGTYRGTADAAYPGADDEYESWWAKNTAVQSVYDDRAYEIPDEWRDFQIANRFLTRSDRSDW